MRSIAVVVVPAASVLVPATVRYEVPVVIKLVILPEPNAWLYPTNPPCPTTPTPLELL